MSDLATGFRYLLKGQRWVARHGKQYGFGLLPGLLTLVLYVGALTSLALYGTDLTAWATPSPTTGRAPGSASSAASSPPSSSRWPCSCRSSRSPR